MIGFMNEYNEEIGVFGQALNNIYYFCSEIQFINDEQNH